MRACVVALALGCVLLAPGCKNQRSTKYDISEISVYFEVVTTAEKTVATAMFSVRGGDVFLYLGAGDSIVVNDVELTRQQGETFDTYTAEIPADESYTFLFRRKDGVYTSNVFAPDGLEVTEPAAGARLSRAAGFNVSWSGSSPGKTLVEVNGDGIVPYRDETLDSGTFTLLPGEVAAQEGSTDAELPATLRVTRTNWGALEPVMEGQVAARVTGEAAFVSVL